MATSGMLGIAALAGGGKICKGLVDGHPLSGDVVDESALDGRPVAWRAVLAEVRHQLSAAYQVAGVEVQVGCADCHLPHPLRQG